METITIRMRFEYYWGLFKDMQGGNCTYEEFMEALFSKLEQEIRDKDSKIDVCLIIKPKTFKQGDYKYDYS